MPLIVPKPMQSTAHVKLEEGVAILHEAQEVDERDPTKLEERVRQREPLPRPQSTAPRLD